MKKIFLYSAVILLLSTTVGCTVLKYKLQSDFLHYQSGKVEAFIKNIDEANPEQKAEIGRRARDLKYHIYTYNSIAFITFISALVLIFRRKKIVKEEN